jgi:hypothetical protein
VANAECIPLLNEKRLVAVGMHQELAAGKKCYRSPVASQQVVLSGTW